MLLQRLGRLWRHEKSFRPTQAKREAWLLVPELATAIEDIKLFGNSAKVYNPYVLCRSLAVWHKLMEVVLPDQIRTLIETTYSEQNETGMLQAYKAELEKKRRELKQLAQFGLSTSGKTLPETASTRYCEQDSVQVLLLSNYQHNADKKGTEITLLNNQKVMLPRGIKFKDKSQWRKLAATLLKNSLQVADHFAPKSVPITELTWLKEYFYLGNPSQDESLLRIAIVNECDEVKNLMGGVASDKYQLSYDKTIGYQANK